MIRKTKLIVTTFCFLLVATFLFSYISLPDLPVAIASEKPSNVHIDSNNDLILLRWTYSHNRSYTTIILNDAVIKDSIFSASTDCLFNITDFIKSPNHYVFKLCAIDDNGTVISDYTIFEHTVSKPLPSPDNVHLINSILLWDEVDNADYYTVLLNSIPITITELSLDLRSYFDHDISTEVTLTAHSEHNEIFLPSAPKTISYDFTSPIPAPQNASLIFFDGEYILSWTKTADASLYYYFAAQTFSGDISCLNLETTASTDQNFANVTALIESGHKTLCLVASNKKGGFSEVASIGV